MGGPDIIDRIDALVDEQLANYENRSGYDHDVNQVQCGHCWRDWHGLAAGQCPGSMFIGLLPPVEHRGGGMVYTAPIGTPLPTNVDFDLLPWTNFGVIDGDFCLTRIGEAVVSIQAHTAAFSESITAAMESVSATFCGIASHLDMEPDTQRQRALPRPSTTPPMWAHNPNHSRRPRRNWNQPNRQGIA